MNTPLKQKGHEIAEPDSEKTNSLILYNDDFHSFEYVIVALVEVCKHTPIQAEQCAYVTHYKGRCDIKNGTYNELKPFKQLLIDRELIVDIE